MDHVLINAHWRREGDDFDVSIRKGLFERDLWYNKWWAQIALVSLQLVYK